MAELRRDPITGRWIIVQTENPDAPSDYVYEPNVIKGEGECPFCYGSESMTPPEIEVCREPSTNPNTPGWGVRVVANRFPALHIEGELGRRGVGIYDMSNGVGAHEVLIETPYHFKDFPELTDREVALVFSMAIRRSLDLMRDKRFKYIMIFKNYGHEAGASIEHPHSQIIALPMVPKNVMEEIKGAQNYFDYRERCLFCDILLQEKEEKKRIVAENEHFLAFCPYVSRFPFEIWVMPKVHNGYFCNMPEHERLPLASIMRAVVAKTKKVFPNMAYNFIIHSSPVNGDSAERGDYHWHIEFIPKLTRIAGFEWGTGFYMIPTPPEAAAEYLNEQKEDIKVIEQ